MRALEFFSCSCTELWMPDNLRSGVTKASRYEPDLNPTYHHLAEHYGGAVLPARARRPKDKAKVENGVLVVTRWVLARLHHQRFFSLNELNRSMRTLLTDLNQRPFNNASIPPFITLLQSKYVRARKRPTPRKLQAPNSRPS